LTLKSNERGGDKPAQHERNFPIGAESSVEPMSGQLHGAVVVAMIAMRVMEPSVHQVIDMITVRDGFVSAGRTMNP
jgi:hypothetical protein